jgi:flagellar biosynthesis/type III secretory pathway chaperone
MLKLIKENLNRQSKAVALLGTLLEEEFSRLMNRKPQSVTQIEFIIQELMRQIASERMSLRGIIKRVDSSAARLGQILPQLNDEDREYLEGKVAEIDKLEQLCAVQATKNQQLAEALLKQSQSLLSFLHKEIQPKNQNVYSARGRYEVSTPNPSLINGRL